MKPDDETKKRIKHLALVGKAIYSAGSDNSLSTDYYIALEALNKFKSEILELELDEESKSGILNLISYLEIKIKRRMNNEVKGY